MTTVSDFSRVVENIREESRKVDPATVFFTALAAVFFYIGKAIGWLFKSAWIVISFICVAFMTGYRIAKPKEGE